jgi:hypothetical protein
LTLSSSASATVCGLPRWSSRWVSLSYRRPQPSSADLRGQTASPLGQGRFIVRPAWHIRTPLPVPHLNRIEALIRIHERVRGVRRVRMSRGTEPTGPVNLIQMPVDHVVSHAIAPVNYLTWADPQREPVSGPRADLLAQDHQQIVANVLAPATMRLGSVVLGGSKEIKSCRTSTCHKLCRRQLAAVRGHRMHMAVTSVPTTPQKA